MLGLGARARAPRSFFLFCLSRKFKRVELGFRPPLPQKGLTCLPVSKIFLYVFLFYGGCSVSPYGRIRFLDMSENYGHPGSRGITTRSVRSGVLVYLVPVVPFFAFNLFQQILTSCARF